MSGAPIPAESSQRLDKWLWAARFFKTRQLAVEAVNGGKVQVDGQRCKPSRTLRPGVRVHIQKGEMAWEIEVRALSKQRRPASEAVLLYEEDEHSRLQRQERARKAREDAPLRMRGRPTKRDRRQIIAFRSQDSDQADH
ncbi:RNA-binding S4 domain-containing protein [Rhabdochromatium marinum]|uniref:RNA-binding S4 domain-containing protein n=1 Tax=Rhabdochromatium marinum TaxID=48729 RepID=UPI001902F440|nr:S4 domain-containing protein [Rhabdochromatium marinum]MBK1647993.1 RNA-binding protein S4 [Rhabdochromatium marinum]